jgi:hypothetical protein
MTRRFGANDFFSPLTRRPGANDLFFLLTRRPGANDFFFPLPPSPLPLAACRLITPHDRSPHKP